MSEIIPLNFNQPPPTELIDQTNTNAMLGLTVYPNSGFDIITQKDVDDFVKQIAGFTKKGRRVFIRFAPEMNGSWFPFGQKPVGFIRVWKQLVTAVRANPFCDNKVAFVFAPNPVGTTGYPFQGGAYSLPNTPSPDLTLLDTNKNGVLDAADDPYTPYYPGDDFVDWVGLSAYFFGNNFPFVLNEMPPNTYFSQLMKQGTINFYDTFCTKAGKPMMITESGTAFHQNLLTPAADTGSTVVAPGPGELAMKQAFWRQFLTNADLSKEFPKIKGICMFEFDKPEELTYRNFHSTNVTLNALKADLDALPKGHYIYADIAIGDNVPIPGGAAEQSYRFAGIIVLGIALFYM
jgi:hypothetical protein